MTTDESCSWLDDAALDLEALERSSGPAIGRRLGAALALLARMNGGQGLRHALLQPGTTPFVRLVGAAASDLGLATDPRVGLVGRATVLLYLYVRMQDDLVDEEARVDRPYIYAMEVALARHLALLADAGLSGGTQRVRADIMARFARAAAEEVDLRAAGDALPTEVLGDKFLPMAVPLVALASLAGRDDLSAALVVWVQRIGSALQLVNDVLNAAEDHALGRPTALLRSVSPETRAHQGNALRAALLSDPATRAALDHARDAAGQARTLAAALRLPGLAHIADGVAANLDRTETRLLGIMLGAAI